GLRPGTVGGPGACRPAGAGTAAPAGGAEATLPNAQVRRRRGRGNRGADAFEAFDDPPSRIGRLAVGLVGSNVIRSRARSTVEIHGRRQVRTRRADEGRARL